jgi:1-acyl-sn-glycerol-3-phosphate acyltransferase
MADSTKILNQSNDISLRAILRALIKSSVFLFIVTVGILSSILLKTFLIPFKKNSFIAINTKYIINPLSKILLFIIGVSIKINNTVPKQDTIFVSNHWGYLDSLTLMALSPCMVLSNTSIKKMFLIGKVMELMGFLFIDRTRNTTIPDIIDKSTFLLNETQLNLVFFPEGGTNDGVQMRSFSTSFFQIGLNTHYDIQPLTINILEINGSIVTNKNINHVVFHGKNNRLIQHIFQLFTLKSIVLQVDLLKPITPDDIAKNNWNRKQIGKKCEEDIKRNLINRNESGI